MQIETQKDTKSAIMDSAEILMAEHGINGVSLREILRDAKANPAALNYHFNSKDGLIQAILDRRGHGIRVRRLELLRALESTDTVPTVVECIDAVVDPLTEFLHEEGEPGRRFLRFLARLHSDRTGIIQKMEKEEYPELMVSMRRVIATACSHLSKKEITVRMGMVVDTMYQSLANAEVMSQDWKGNGHAAALDEYVSTLKRFLRGGLSAPG
jgi:AcrR family transcriptional regulator